jgi:hypothetical protein
VTCNGRDDDCNAATLDAPDADGDGVTVCAGDCDDTRADVRPGLVEVTCNGRDDDCNAATLDAPDADGDGVTVCAGDCDDTRADVRPGLAEECTSGRDDDCDGHVDCADPDCATAPACSGGTCLAPIDLAGTGVVTLDTSGRSNLEVGTCQAATGGEVVYRLTLTGTSDLHVDTAGSDYDTVLYLRQGACTAVAETACSDNVNANHDWSRLELTDLPAGTYYLVADSALPATGGHLFLNVVVTPAGTLPTVPVASDPLVRMPGTQPANGVTLESPNRCGNCHGGYDAAVEPERNWKGSLMAHASRDPLFWATFVVAAQDAIWATGRPNGVDLCERCHFPAGWMGGRSDPPNASAFTGADFDGVSCDVCHTQVDPFFEATYAGTREGNDWLGYWDETNLSSTPSSAAALTTRTADRTVSQTLRLFNGNPMYTAAFVPAQTAWTENGSGQFINSTSADKRASFADADAKHGMLYSRYHKSRYNCGTCHDVSNAILANLPYAGAVPGDGVTVLRTESEPPSAYYHVERTFSEFMLSAFGQGGGAAGVGPFAPGTFDTSQPGDLIASCQDCHMADKPGKGCNKAGAPFRPTGSTEHPRSGQPVHDLTGGGAWVARVLASTVVGSANYDATNAALLGQGPAVLTLDLAAGQGIDPAALLDGALRAEAQIGKAAAVSGLTYQAGTGALAFRIVNQTGHKLLSGYPEGRRMIVNVKAFQGATLLAEINPYDDAVGTLKGLSLEHAPDSPPLEAHERYEDALVYEMISSSALTGEEHTFHFVLGTERYKDNRIPPQGFRSAEAASRLAEPVWHGASDLGYFTAAEYAGGYDDVALTIPAGADRVEVRVYYQSTTREYVAFLRDEINGIGATLPSPTPAGNAVAYVAQREPFFAKLAAWGDTIWALWEHNQHLPGATPILMSSATWTP